MIRQKNVLAPQTNQNKHPITIYITTAMTHKIDELAYKLGKNRNQMVRLIFEEWLNQK